MTPAPSVSLMCWRLMTMKRFELPFQVIKTPKPVGRSGMPEKLVGIQTSGLRVEDSVVPGTFNAVRRDASSTMTKPAKPEYCTQSRSDSKEVASVRSVNAGEDVVGLHCANGLDASG